MPRDRRRAGVRVVLGPRDEALLRALGRMRLARTVDLTSLFFQGVRRDTAAGRLRRLHDAGFIEARVVGLNDPNLYHLGPEGVRWAREKGLTAGRPSIGSPAHHLAVVDAWARLAAALGGNRTLRLSRFEPDWELRSRLAGASPPVIPDAVVELRRRGEDAPHGFALEVDLTTERRGTLERKLAAYDLNPYFPDSKAVGLLVVLFGAGPRRQCAVQEIARRSWSGSSDVFLEAQWPEGLLGALALTPLADSPCGRGRPASATDSTAQACEGQGEGPSR